MGASGVLVGRERELSVLRAWLAAAEQPAIVLCGGEPGIGKTRLAEEVAALAAAQGVPTAWGRATEAEGTPACWPWRQVLRELSSLDGSLAVAERLGVTGALGVLAPEAFPGAESSLADGGPERRFEVFDAISRFLCLVAGQRGLLVVLDDVHWADPASLLLLRHLAAYAGTGRLMVIATLRPTQPGMAGLLADLARERVIRLDLAGIAAPAVARQLEALTGAPVARAQADRVHHLTGGNPFFVADLARHWRQAMHSSGREKAVAWSRRAADEAMRPPNERALRAHSSGRPPNSWPPPRLETTPHRHDEDRENHASRPSKPVLEPFFAIPRRADCFPRRCSQSARRSHPGPQRLRRTRPTAPSSRA